MGCGNMLINFFWIFWIPYLVPISYVIPWTPLKWGLQIPNVFWIRHMAYYPKALRLLFHIMKSPPPPNLPPGAIFEFFLIVAFYYRLDFLLGPMINNNIWKLQRDGKVLYRGDVLVVTLSGGDFLNLAYNPYVISH